MDILITCLADVGVLLWYQRDRKRNEAFFLRVLMSYILMLLLVLLIQPLTAKALHQRLLITYLYYFLVIAWMYQRVSKKENLLRTLFLVISIIVSELLVTVSVMLATDAQNSIILMEESRTLLLLQVMAKILEINILNFVNWIEKIKQRKETLKFLYYTILFLIVYYLCFHMLLMIETPSEKRMKTIMVVNILFIFFILAGMFYYIRIWKKEMAREQYIEKLKSTIQYQNEYYEEISKIRSEIFFIYHEMLHMVLKNEEITEADRKKHSEKFIEYVTRFGIGEKITLRTGSTVMDAFLFRLRNRCKENKIDFSQAVTYEESIFPEPYEIAGLIIQAIEEGFDCCMQQEGERVLSVASGTEHGLYIIKVEYSGTLRIEEKENEKLQKREILKKYRGEEVYQKRIEDGFNEHILCFNLYMSRGYENKDI